MFLHKQGLILIGTLLLIALMPHVAASDQPKCGSLEGTLTFVYRCTGNQEDLCIKGRHLRVPESNCDLLLLDPDKICIPCEEGTFMDSYNSCDYCKPHKQCGPDEVENTASPPSAFKDRECIPRPQPSEPPGSQGSQSLAPWTAAKPDDPSSTAHPTEEDSVSGDARVSPVEGGPWKIIGVVFIGLFSITLIILVGVCLWNWGLRLWNRRLRQQCKQYKDVEDAARTTGQNHASQGSRSEVINGDASRSLSDIATDETQGGQQPPPGNNTVEHRALVHDGPYDKAPICYAGSSSNRDRVRKEYNVEGNTPSGEPLLDSVEMASLQDNSMSRNVDSQSLTSVPDEGIAARYDDTQLNESIVGPSMRPTGDYDRSLSAYEKADGQCGRVTRCNEDHIDFVKDNINSKKLGIVKDVDECFLTPDTSINILLHALEASGNWDVSTNFKKKFHVR